MEGVSSFETDTAATETRPPVRRGLRRLIGGASLDYLVGGVVLGVYLTVQLWLLQGPRPLDPAKYFDTAVDFPNVPVDLWTLRIGLIAPVRLALLVFGASEAALYAVPIAAGLVLAGAVYGTTLLLFGDRVTAVAAALVTVLNPSYLYQSSYIYPDAAATATFTAGFFLLVLAAVRVKGGDQGWTATLAIAGAGVLFGWTYLIREFSPLLLLPAVGGAVVFLGYSRRRIALLAGVALATAGLELVYGLVRYGDPFIHARRLLGRNEGSRSDRMDFILSQLDNVLDTFVVFPRLLVSWRSGWLFLLLIVVLLVALALLRDSRIWMLAVWSLSFWAIMVVIGLGELPSGRWILNVTNVRYWYPILPAIAMGALGGLWLLLRRWFPSPGGVRAAQASTAALAIVTLAPGLAEFKSCSDRRAEGNDPARRWNELRSWFTTEEADRFDAVWTDAITERLVPVYTATTFGNRVWHGEVATFVNARRIPAGTDLIPASTDLSDALVLVQKDRFRLAVRGAQRRLEELREQWSPVFVSTDGNLVLLAHRSAGASTAQPGDEWWKLSSSFVRVAPGTCGRTPYADPDS